MLTPPLSTAPFWSAAPERMLPVWPGWMPTPVAFLLNRPVTTFSRVRKGARGSRLLPRARSAPAPLAHQWLGLIPLPMNSAAKRLGKAGVPTEVGSSPQTGRDSSQGRAIATPTPRSMVRRSMGESGNFMDRSPRVRCDLSQGVEVNGFAGLHLLDQAEDFYSSP